MDPLQQEPRELPPLTRRREVLLAWLEVIDTQGWGGPAARELLEFIRVDMVRPLVVYAGLRGIEAGQAECTAWQEVWFALRRSSLRGAAEPWGVLWGTARRAALGERVTAKYLSSVRDSWRYEQDVREGRMDSPVSLDELLDRGWAPSDPTAKPDEAASVAATLDDAVGALRSAGWPADTARLIVAIIMLDVREPDPRCTTVGWRALASQADIAPWQARRLMVLLRGTPSSPGLIRRLHDEGRDVLLEAPVRHALYASRRQRVSPTYAVVEVAQGSPQRLAS